MEELFKGIASSAGVCGVLLVYYILQVKPAIAAYQQAQSEENQRMRDSLDKMRDSYQQTQAQENDKMRDRLDKMRDSLNIFARVSAMRIATAHDVHPELIDAAKQAIKEIDEQSQK